MRKTVFKRPFVVGLIGLMGIVMLAAAPAQSALAAPRAATHTAAAASPSVTPDGGTGANFCGSIKINGKATSPNDWVAYGHKVGQSVRVTPPSAGFSEWCVKQSFNPDCLLSVEGLAFTLLGVGAEARAVISVAGGGALSIAAIFTAC